MPNKKSFKSDVNPVMQFISQPEEAPQEETSVTPPIQAEKAPAGYKLNPLYIETKSRRLQLLVQPSMHNRLKERAAKEGKSINELVNIFLENGLGEE